MRYEYGNFVIDSTTSTIFIDQIPIKCDDRIVQLLHLLAQHYPVHCDTQFLLTELWPQRVVSSSSLTRLVSDSRAFFRAQGIEQPLIQTLHGRGYRLAHELAQQCPALTQQGSDSASRQQRFMLYGKLAALLTVLVLSASKLWWHFNLTSAPGAALVINEPENARARILWVDDHPENNIEEREFLQAQNIAVYQATTTKDALLLLAMYDYQVILTDMGRQDDALAGLRFTEQLRKQGITTPVIVYTLLSNPAQQQIALEHGANAVAIDKATLYQLLHTMLPVSP